MADDQLEPLVIEQVDVDSPLKVTLEKTDLPFGRRRELAAFESGGKVHLGEEGGTYLPGNPDPIFHVQQWRERPLTIKGAFRDDQWGVEGHARSMRDQVLAMAKRPAIVRITWGGDTRHGLLQEPTFGEEDQFNITYELKFLISKGTSNSASQTPDPDDKATDTNQEMIAQMQADVAEMKATALALELKATVRAELTAAWATTEDALANAGATVDALAAQQADRGIAFTSAARAIDTSAAAAQVAVGALSGSMGTLTAVDAMDRQGNASSVGWAQSQTSTVVGLAKVTGNLRTMRLTARNQVREATRVYTVKPGDTLESIALELLGSRARANELGLRSSDLESGKPIRVPRGS